MKAREIAVLLLLAIVTIVAGCGCVPDPTRGAIDGYIFKHSDARSAQAVDEPGFGVASVAPRGALSGLGGAWVVAEGPHGNAFAKSRSDGYFKLDRLPPGYYEVTITHEDYPDTYQTSCWVVAGQTTPIGGTPMLGSLHILAVGIDDYDSPEISDLSFAVADAQLVATRLGVENKLAKQCTVLTDRGAARNSIQEAIQSIGNNITDGDTFIMFFSGHGMQNAAGTTEYIAPSDANKWDPNTMIPDWELNAWINEYMPEYAKKIFIFDSCHSGGMYKSLAALPAGFTWSTGFGVMAKNIVGPSKIVMTACDKGESSYETDEFPINGHGVFTWAFTEGMRDPYPADSDGNRGAITTEEAYYYASYWTTRHSPAQHPQIYRGDPGFEWYWYLFTYQL